MSNNTVKIPLDVLSYWYQSAVQAKKRYERPAYEEERLYDREKAEKRKTTYRMAVKTVESLKDVFVNVEIIESEKKENE